MRLQIWKKRNRFVFQTELNLKINMRKKDKHQHKAPYSKVKIIEDLLIKSDLGKTKWHRIFGLCLVLRPYDNNGNTIVNSSYKHIQIFDGKKWTDIIGKGELGFIANQVVNKDDLFDTPQDDEQQNNLLTRIKIIS